MSSSTKTLLHVVCDYQAGGLEFGEIMSQFYQHLSEPEKILIHQTSVPSLDTMAIGFVTAQYALADFSGRMVIYGNAAPRRSSSKASKNNQDNGIFYARLNNGAEIINVNSEFAFGFVKDQIVEFRNLDCPNAGSQFRSRDFFPKAVSRVLSGDKKVFLEELDPADIPDIPHNLVAWTDGFGNIKTTMRRSDLEKMGLTAGQKVQVILNGVSMLGVVAVGGFAVDRGVLAINIGSSGYEDPFVELFLRVHKMSEQTAAVRFGYPAGGESFELRKV
jgi:hypothetical protein